MITIIKVIESKHKKIGLKSSEFILLLKIENETPLIKGNIYDVKGLTLTLKAKSNHLMTGDKLNSDEYLIAFVIFTTNKETYVENSQLIEGRELIDFTKW